MNKLSKIIAAIAGAGIVAGSAAACTSTHTATHTVPGPTVTQTATAPVPPASAEQPITYPATAPSSSAPATPAAPDLTSSQQQAVDSAKSYLGDGQGFSYNGLLQQLTSSYGEGFDKSDAVFAIDYLTPDWDAQAAAAAKGYLNDGEGFSRDSLIQQLTSSYGNGFTQDQATYGVDQAGL